MLVTFYLMLVNLHNSVEAPSGRGFSNLEIWFVGTQAPIAFAIIEYVVMLAMKRFSRLLNQEISFWGRFSYEPEKIMDIISFIISGGFILLFTIVYIAYLF